MTTTDIVPATFERILSNLNLKSIDSMDLHATCSKDKIEPKEIEIQIDGDFGFKITDGAFVAQVSYKVTGTRKGDVVINIAAVYNVMYETMDEIPEDFPEIYKTNVAPQVTLPYFREWVQSATCRMGIQPIMLPHLIFSHIPDSGT